ncbi:MAG: hypothetical protein ACJAVM_001744 [Sulfitobacter sp.]|jgi:hypothetical protein
MGRHLVTSSHVIQEADNVRIGRLINPADGPVPVSVTQKEAGCVPPRRAKNSGQNRMIEAVLVFRPVCSPVKWIRLSFRRHTQKAAMPAPPVSLLSMTTATLPLPSD